MRRNDYGNIQIVFPGKINVRCFLLQIFGDGKQRLEMYLCATVLQCCIIFGTEIANGGVRNAISASGNVLNSGLIQRFYGRGNYLVGELGLGFMSDARISIYKDGFEITFARKK